MIHLAFTKWIKLEIAMTCGTKERNLQIMIPVSSLGKEKSTSLKQKLNVNKISPSLPSPLFIFTAQQLDVCNQILTQVH